MVRRLRDALALLVIAANAHHALTLACRYVEARCQLERDTDCDPSLDCFFTPN
jgi:hypothetical protein